MPKFGQETSHCQFIHLLIIWLELKHFQTMLNHGAQYVRSTHKMGRKALNGANAIYVL